MTDQLLAQPVLAATPIWVLQHVPWMVFVFCFGGCVGSFVNVVVYRLPMGMSVVSPPSRCPTCGARLRFFRENVPIIGWFMIRGRCRYCGEKVSSQYMLIEMLMAFLFLGLYVVLFIPGPSGTSWWAAVGGPWWPYNQFYRVWPAYMALAFMVAALVAMTLIDARTMTIQIQIPLFVTATAFVAYPLQAVMETRSYGTADWPIPGVTWPWFLAAAGGMLGVLISAVRLWRGAIKESFDDYYDHVKDGDAIGDYPHARREMRVEILFLLPCIAGMVGGYLFAGLLPMTQSPPPLVQAVGATLLGYLSGGGMIWAIRILGTLVFGREAMGLGDVHLLAAVGAVLGWYDPILIFFIAPFSGILWVLVSILLSSVLRIARRELPYGPHLAVATLIVLVCRPGLDALLNAILPGVPLPGPGFV